MRFVILRILRHNELGMFHSYRRLQKEKAKQRAINFDSNVVDRVFPAAKDDDIIELDLKYETDHGIELKRHRIKRQEKNWRLEGNCPRDILYDFVDPGCLFAMVVDSGTKPATGAWAIYPPDHEVMRSVISHSESSQLTTQSMIALYGSEGGYTLDLLCESKPELFASHELQLLKADVLNNLDSSNSVHLPPNPRKLVRILASVGHSLSSAVADIVDNSITADANEIDVTFREPDQGHGRWMAISDNGKGMDRNRLAEGMRIGTITEYDERDLGKYGYGLKGASWSQAESFTVVTRQQGEPQHHLSWDVKTMGNWEASKAELEPWITKEISLGDHGTCVFWKDMRPPRHVSGGRGVDPYTAEIRDLSRHLGLVFHRFITGDAKGRKAVTIRINGISVSPNDPVGYSKVRAYDKKPIRVPTASKDVYVDVQAFLLPSEQELKEVHKEDTEAFRTDIDRLSMYGRRNESQGLYLYRNDRLIQWGGWHQLWATSDEKTKLARVIVDFGSALDDQFSVNISKQKVVLPQQVQEYIKKLADEARKDSRKKYLDARPDKKKYRTGVKGHEKPIQPQLTPTGGLKPQNTVPSNGHSGGNNSVIVPMMPVRLVRNADFSWKISKAMTGQEEIQISQHETALQSLFNSLTTNEEALTHLTGFLRRLDEAGVQNLLSIGNPA